MVHFRKALLAVALSAAPMAAIASPYVVPKPFAAGAEHIIKLSHGQAQILKAFPTKAGLNGYAVQISPGHALIMYTSKNGKYLFMGGVFNPAGQNLSVRYAHQYLPQTDLPKVFTPAEIAQAIHKTTHFLIGNPKAPKTVWMIADPNCIFCHLAWQHLKPAVNSGTLKIQMVPVGFLKPSSAPKAETILASKSPAKSWRFDEAHFNKQEEEGGIVPLTKIPKTDVRDIQANTQWMDGHGINGTPYMLYLNHAGQWTANPGMPEDTKAFLAGIEG